MQSRSNLEELLDRLVELAGNKTSGGNYTVSDGRQVATVVSDIRELLRELDQSVVVKIRTYFHGDEHATQLLRLLLERENADSFKIAEMVNKNFKADLCILVNDVSEIEEDAFVNGFGTTRIIDGNDEGEKPFLDKPLDTGVKDYLAKRAANTLFSGGDSPQEESVELSPLRACIKAMLDLAKLEGKKGSRTANIGSYMTRTKTLREAYAHLDEEGKATLASAMDNSGVKRIVDAIVDRNNLAPQSNKATALWMALRKNQDVKDKLADIYANEGQEHSSTPQPKENK